MPGAPGRKQVGSPPGQVPVLAGEHIVAGLLGPSGPGQPGTEQKGSKYGFASISAESDLVKAANTHGSASEPAGNQVFVPWNATTTRG